MYQEHPKTGEDYAYHISKSRWGIVAPQRSIGCWMPSYIHSLYHLSLGGDAKLLSPSVVGWVRLLGRHSLICPQYLFNGIISSWWFQPMKNMSQIENLPKVRVKIQNIWNHQDIQSASYRLSVFYSPKSLFVFSPHEHLHLDACLKKNQVCLYKA